MAERSNHHRDTLAEIFDHQGGGNVEWRKVHSLLEAIGTVTEEHNGKLKVEIGRETEVLTRPGTRTSTARRSSTCAGC